MHDTNSTPGPRSIKAARAIINSTIVPALRHDASNVTVRHLAEIIERETNVTGLLEAAREAMKEIDYHHRDMLTGEERDHPRGSGWARVYDKLRAACDRVKG
jgi:hypothetical protein